MGAHAADLAALGDAPDARAAVGGGGQEAPGIFDLIVWVDRSEHLPPEPITSMDLVEADADVTIDNNGTLDDLARNVEALIKERFPYVLDPPRDKSLDFKAGIYIEGHWEPDTV